MSSQDGFLPVGVHGIADHIEKTVSDDTFETVFGTPDWIRTSGLQSRSLSLYPTELRAHIGLWVSAIVVK